MYEVLDCVGSDQRIFLFGLVKIYLYLYGEYRLVIFFLWLICVLRFFSMHVERNIKRSDNYLLYFLHTKIPFWWIEKNVTTLFGAP